MIKLRTQCSGGGGPPTTLPSHPHGWPQCSPCPALSHVLSLAAHSFFCTSVAILTPGVLDMGKKSDISGHTMAQKVCLKELGYTTKIISERCGVCPHSVRRWMAPYNSQERHTLPTQKKRPGRAQEDWQACCQHCET